MTKKTIRICFIEASERLDINNTVQARRSAVADNQHLACVSERCDLAYMPIADNHLFLKCKDTQIFRENVFLPRKFYAISICRLINSSSLLPLVA